MCVCVCVCLRVRVCARVYARVYIVHLKERLEEYIKQWNGLVKVFRNEKREGLIQARSIGAKKATKGQVTCDLTAAASLPTYKVSFTVFYHWALNLNQM